MKKLEGLVDECLKNLIQEFLIFLKTLTADQPQTLYKHF